MTDSSVMWLHPETKVVSLVESTPISEMHGIVDYKFFCFEGEPKFAYVSQDLDNHSEARVSFIDMEWRVLPFGRTDYRPFKKLPPKPQTFDEMTRLARELSADIPLVRVDFFEYQGRPRFSEMTFYHCSGFMPFDPPEWDERVGELLTLPNV